MAMCESLHSNSPLPPLEHKYTTPTYQQHLSATSLTLLWQSLRVLGPIGMIVRIGRRVSWDPKSFVVILPVIITARNQKWLLQLFALHIYIYI